jgi:hypothetical protein
MQHVALRTNGTLRHTDPCNTLQDGAKYGRAHAQIVKPHHGHGRAEHEHGHQRWALQTDHSLHTVRVRA